MVRSKRKTIRRVLVPLLASLMLVSWVVPALGVTTLDGYSSLMTELRSSGGGDPSWGLDNPQFYAEFRLKSSPWKDIDSFLKISAESNKPVDDAEDTRFLFKEAHVRFHANRFETHLFAGQDRFWLNEPLLQIVHSDQVKHDDWGPRAQGIRLDFWDFYGFSGAAFASERSDYIGVDWLKLNSAEQGSYAGSAAGDTISSSTDDYRGFRVNKKLLRDRLYLGTTYARKDMTFDDSSYIGDRGKFQEVIAFDAEVALGDVVPFLTQFGRVIWVAEYGRNTSGELWGTDDADVDGFKTEIRDVSVGPMRFLGSWQAYGKDFYADELAHGDRQNENDYTQYYFEGHYRVPTKAVNLKGWIRHAEPEDPMSTSFAQSTGTIDEWGTEAYVEFLNGFTGKTEYKVYQDNNGVWPNLLFELIGENRLVKLRTQFRIKDIDSDYELTAYGFEANVNLSDVWKFYTRVMNVDEATESRQTAFAQVRYLGWNSAEFFIEFGNPDQSNDLVNDGDFV
ncbi:hypothetical protein KAW64_05560, partial [bacterium]|nr:hypothetical protein [bacterium]